MNYRCITLGELRACFALEETELGLFWLLSCLSGILIRTKSMGAFVPLPMHSVSQLDSISLMPATHLLSTESCLLPLHFSHPPHVDHFIPPGLFLFFFFLLLLLSHLIIAVFLPPALFIVVLSSLSRPPAGVWLEKVDLSKRRHWLPIIALFLLLFTFPPSLLSLVPFPTDPYLLFLALSFLPLPRWSQTYISISQGIRREDRLEEKSAFFIDRINSLPLSHHRHLLSHISPFRVFSLSSIFSHLPSFYCTIIIPHLSPSVSLHHDVLCFLSAPVTD